MEILIDTDTVNDACYIGFSNRVLEKGSVARSVRVNEDIALDFAEDGRLLGLDVLNASRVISEQFWKVKLDSLIGVKEAAELAGVKRPNFVRDYASKPDFPSPVSDLATGRVWLRSQVEKYISARKSQKAARSSSS